MIKKKKHSLPQNIVKYGSYPMFGCLGDWKKKKTSEFYFSFSGQKKKC